MQKSLAAWRQYAPVESARHLSKIMKFRLLPARFAHEAVDGLDVKHFVISATFFAVDNNKASTRKWGEDSAGAAVFWKTNAETLDPVERRNVEHFLPAVTGHIGSGRRPAIWKSS